MTLPIVALIVSLLFYTACVAVEPTTNFSDSPKPSQKDLDLAERYLKNHLQSAPRNLVGRIKPQSIDSFRTWIERQEQRDQVGNVCENIVPRPVNEMGVCQAVHGSLMCVSASASVPVRFCGKIPDNAFE